MRQHRTLAIALVALLACGAPNDASNPASPNAADANSGLAGDRGPSTAATGLSGTVSGLTGSCPAVAFTLEGKAIATSAATRYEGGACADLKNGVRIKVAGTTQSNGSVAAQTIGFAAPVTTTPTTPTEPKTPTVPTAAVKGTASEVAGTCPTLSLKLEGISIKTTATTRYEGGACADVKNGVLMSATGTVQADRSIVAQSIGIATATPVAPPRPKEPTTSPTPTATPTLKGIASEVAGTCPVVSLKLEGKKITTTATTRYEGGACADLKNGAAIAVAGTGQADGSIQATVIWVSR